MKWEEPREQEAAEAEGSVWKKRVWWGLVTFCTVILVFSAFHVWRTVHQSRQENDTFLELAKLAEHEGAAESGLTGTDGKESGDQAKQSRYAVIAGQNPDFAGWLKIDRTVIDYPVMYTPEDVQYYIRRDFYGKESVSGTPFIGDHCNVDSQGMIIYGHNMKNDTIFGALDEYADRDYWREHPVIRFSTVEEEREYEVFAAFRTRLLYENEEGFRYYEYVGDLTEETFGEFVEQAEAAALYDTGIRPEYGDQFLMLSTCSYHTKNGRFVVAARRTR